MNSNNKLTANELMDILSTQLRTLHETDVNDRNIMKHIAKSKEIFNGAGKVIKLSEYEMEKQRLGHNQPQMLPEGK